MRYVQLGDQRASAIGLGVMQFGAPGWGWDTEFGIDDARRIVDRAMELGINFFDTAEMYVNGRSEEILGEALGDRRPEVIVASKVSPQHLTRRGVVEAARRSLRRLGTNKIDLFQIHWPNPLVPHSWAIRGMRDLLDDGRIGNVGVSNYSAKRWRKAEELLGGAVSSNQVNFHLLDRGPETELLPYARQNGRAIIAYSPLGQGRLSGRYTPTSGPGGTRSLKPSFSVENLRRLEPVIEVIRSVAHAHGATPAQVALAWVISDPHVIAIPGAKSVEQLEANAAAAEISLSDGRRQQLEDAAASFRPVPLAASMPRILGGLLLRVVRGG